MAKVTHHGLAKPDDPVYQEGYTISTVHGLNKPSEDETPQPKPTSKSKPRPADQ
jgi:hypothetical protein